MNIGSKVLIIGGNHTGEFGTYLYHSHDSGYYVPFVLLPDDPIDKYCGERLNMNYRCVYGRARK